MTNGPGGTGLLLTTTNIHETARREFIKIDRLFFTFHTATATKNNDIDTITNVMLVNQFLGFVKNS
jgi:hypothetical protein